MPLTGYERDFLHTMNRIADSLERIDSKLASIDKNIEDLASYNHCQPTDEELQEMFEDMEADRIIDEQKNQVIWEP